MDISLLRLLHPDVRVPDPLNNHEITRQIQELRKQPRFSQMDPDQLEQGIRGDHARQIAAAVKEMESRESRIMDEAHAAALAEHSGVMPENLALHWENNHQARRFSKAQAIRERQEAGEAQLRFAAQAEAQQRAREQQDRQAEAAAEAAVSAELQRREKVKRSLREAREAIGKPQPPGYWRRMQQAIGAGTAGPGAALRLPIDTDDMED